MEFLDLVKKRRSVRDYLEKEIGDDLLHAVLEAGRLAPSACNKQPWIFIVLKGRESRDKLKILYNREWFWRAPLVIAVCCDRTSSWRRSDGRDFGDIDIAIAVDHMTLAAADLGLGTCWIGNFNPAKAAEALMLPPLIDPVVLTPLGFPAPAVPAEKSRKEINAITHWEYYGGKKQ